MQIDLDAVTKWSLRFLLALGLVGVGGAGVWKWEQLRTDALRADNLRLRRDVQLLSVQVRGLAEDNASMSSFIRNELFGGNVPSVRAISERADD